MREATPSIPAKPTKTNRDATKKTTTAVITAHANQTRIDLPHFNL